MAEAVRDHRRPRHARGVRRAHPRPGPRGRRDRRRLHLGRRADPLGARSSTSAWTCTTEAAVTLLAADIGNSHTVARAARRRRGASRHWRVATDERRTADEWAVLLRGLLGGRARTSVDGHRGLRDGAVGAARVARDAARCTSPTCRGVVVEPGVAHRRPGADGQPARGRLRPHRQRARRRPRLTAAPRSWSTSATATTFDVVSARGPVRRRRDRPRHRDLAGGARPARRPAAQGRAAAAARR